MQKRRQQSKRSANKSRSPHNGNTAQETLFHSSFGDVNLQRFPKEKDPTLRAWSAADELLLSHLKTEILPTLDSNPKLLVANDPFGAVSICTAQFSPTLWSDSYIGEQALQKNLALNSEQLGPEANIHFKPSTRPLTQPIDIALLSLPKNHHFLKFQLEHIKSKLTENGLVICSVMAKHFHPNALKFFEEAIGETHTSLAVKKARLIISRNTKKANAPTTKPLANYANSYSLENSPVALKTLPNVFSWEKLDIGTRALLPCIPKGDDPNTILDLGCGNGALGIQAALNNPNARIIFCDESYLAIESAKLSVDSANLQNECKFIVTDTLKNAPQGLDLILCNPPFHQQNSMHTGIADRMFKQAHQHLSPSGQLLVVANRHLQYQGSLRKLFQHTDRILDNSKFVVYMAKK